MLRSLLFVLLLSVFGAAGAGACATTAATATTVVATGILIRASGLFSGVGCGTNADQAFKYVAVISDVNGRVVSAQVYDCFADAAFVNLPGAFPPGSVTLSYAYTFQIYAYNEATYDPNTELIGKTVTAINDTPPDANPPANGFVDIPATWTTTCQATEQGTVQVFAVCQPITLVGSIDAGPPVATEGGADAGLDGDAGMDAAVGMDGAAQDGAEEASDGTIPPG